MGNDLYHFFALAATDLHHASFSVGIDLHLDVFYAGFYWTLVSFLVEIGPNPYDAGVDFDRSCVSFSVEIDPVHDVVWADFDLSYVAYEAEIDFPHVVVLAVIDLHYGFCIGVTDLNLHGVWAGFDRNPSHLDVL